MGLDLQSLEKKIIDSFGERRLTALSRIAEPTIDEEKRTATFPFASEVELKRWFGIEKLNIREGRLNLDLIKDGGSLLLNHDPNRQIGVVEDAWIDKKDGRAFARVRFSRSSLGEEVFDDVKTGIRRNVSFGYKYNKISLLEEREDEPVFSVDDADVLEVSIVGVPADFSVGLGRSADNDTEEFRKEVLTLIKERKGEAMGKRVGGSMEGSEMETKDSLMQVSMTSNHKGERDAEIREMLSIGREFSALDMAADFVQQNRSIEDLRSALLKKMASSHVQAPSTYKRSEGSTFEERDIKKFSLVNLILTASDPNFRGGGYEREISDQAKRDRGMSGRTGCLIPSEVFAGIVQRDGLFARPQGDNLAKGFYAVGTETLGSEFIRSFYPSSVILQLGARSMPNLTGNISIPKQTNSVTAEWVAEGVSPKGSALTIGQVPMSPKRVATFTEYTRVFLTQASIGVEAFIRDDLQTRIGLAIDAAAIRGEGTNNEPLGILGNKEVPVLEPTAGTLSFASLVDMETEVAGANAQGPSMAYLSHTKVRGYLKVVPEGPQIQQRIWSLGDLNSGDGVVNGYRAKVSNQMPGGATGEKATIIFGDFSQIMIGEWGGLYLESNPWIKQGEGIIRMHVEALADVAIRHPESFCILRNIDLTKFPEIQNLGPGSVDGPTERGSIRRRGRGGSDE